MRYSLLRQDAHPDWWHTVVVEGVSLDALRAGLPVEAPSTPVRVTISALGSEPVDFLELPCPIVSDAMRRALERAGVDNVEYFAAHIESEYGEGAAVATDYWVANVVGTVACAAALPVVARATSETADAPARGPSPGFIVDSTRAHGFGLFRLAGDRRGDRDVR